MLLPFSNLWRNTKLFPQDEPVGDDLLGANVVEKETLDLRARNAQQKGINMEYEYVYLIYICHLRIYVYLFNYIKLCNTHVIIYIYSTLCDYMCLSWLRHSLGAVQLYGDCLTVFPFSCLRKRSRKRESRFLDQSLTEKNCSHTWWDLVALEDFFFKRKLWIYVFSKPERRYRMTYGMSLCNQQSHFSITAAAATMEKGSAIKSQSISSLVYSRILLILLYLTNTRILTLY